jgi:hypothetical protein
MFVVTMWICTEGKQINTMDVCFLLKTTVFGSLNWIGCMRVVIKAYNTFYLLPSPK